MATEATGGVPSLEEQKRMIDEIHWGIDDATMEALDRIEPSLSDAIKTLRPENIEFGEPIKLRKHLFSGTIGGSIEIYSKKYNYNSYTKKVESEYCWKPVRNFYGDHFSDYVGWLICNWDYDCVSILNGIPKDMYAKYAIEVHGEGTNGFVFPSENPKKKILSLKDKQIAALNLALSFGETAVRQATWTSVESYRCGFVSLSKYDCTETDEYVELPVRPIFISLNNGKKSLIGAYFAAQKKIHIQFYGKEYEIDNLRSKILKERRKQKRKRIAGLCLKILGGALLLSAAIAFVLKFLL